MRIYRSLAAVCAVGICALGAHAQAQSAADKARATTLVKQGVADMEAGKFDEGCPKIQESLQLDRQPGTLFTLAECEASLDQVKTAVALYNEYLGWYQQMTPSQQASQGKRQSTAQQAVAKLFPQIPELILTLPPNPPSGTVVTLDDSVLSAGELGRAIQVNPGVRVVTTKAPGGPITKMRVMIGKGAKQQVALSVTPGPAALAASSAPPPTPAASASSSAAPPSPPASASASSSAAPASPPASASAAASSLLRPPPPPPASASAAPSSLLKPPPAGSSAAPVASAPPLTESVPGAPKIHIDASQPITLVAVSPTPNGGTYTQPACHAPCDQIIDGRAGQSFFFAGDGVTASSMFELRGKSGDLSVRVDPGSSAVRTGGTALTTMGALGFAGGIPLFVVGAANHSPGAQAAGGVLFGVGISALVTGIVMIVRSGTSYQFQTGSVPGQSQAGSVPGQIRF